MRHYFPVAAVFLPDFVSDWVVGPEKQPVRVINIMDECSRRALWTEAEESIFDAIQAIINN